MGFDFSFPLAPVAKVQCGAIAKEMMSGFGISREEAVGRINRHWHGAEFVEDDDVATLMLELPDYWARRIYYPSETDWWVTGEEGLEGRPYP